MLSLGPVTKQVLKKVAGVNLIELWLTSNEKISKYLTNKNTSVATNILKYINLPLGLWRDVATILKEA